MAIRSRTRVWYTDDCRSHCRAVPVVSASARFRAHRSSDLRRSSSSGSEVIVEVIQLFPPVRISERLVEHVVDVPVPQILDKSSR